MKIRTTYIFFSLLILLFSGCIKKDLEDLQINQWKPEVALPLIYSGYSAGEVIEQFETNGNLTSGEGDIITIVYSGKLFTIDAQDLVSLPNIGYIFPDTTLEVDLGNTIQGQYKSLELNSGFMSYNIGLDYQKDVIIELVIPKATKDNQVFSKYIDVPFKGNPDLTTSGTLDLSGYNFDLSGDDGTGFNQFRMYYIARDKKTGKHVTINTFSGSIQELRFHLITGFFDEFNYNIDKEIVKLDIFEHFKKGKVIIEDPRLHLKFLNSFGIPVGANLSSFKGNSNGVYFPLTGSYINSVINVDFPGINDANQTVETNYFINKDNSDIRNFVSFTPGSVEYEFDVNLNLNKDNTKINFIRDSSKFQGNLDLEIPFHATLDNVLLIDTFKTSLEKVEDAESIEFKLITDNSFPIDIGLQFVFLDENGISIDSLIPNDQNIFRSGPVNSEGVVTKNVITVTKFGMDQSRFDRVNKATHIAMKIKLISGNNGQQSVKFLNSSAIGIKLGVIAKLTNLTD